MLENQIRIHKGTETHGDVKELHTTLLDDPVLVAWRALSKAGWLSLEPMAAEDLLREVGLHPSRKHVESTVIEPKQIIGETDETP